eukprot:7539524-Pyramimonas_sp.AAC.1
MRSDTAKKSSAAHRAIARPGASVNTKMKYPTATALWGSAVTGISEHKLHSLRVAAIHAKGNVPPG